MPMASYSQEISRTSLLPRIWCLVQWSISVGFFNTKEYKDKVMECHVIHKALARGEISSEDYKRGDFSSK